MNVAAFNIIHSSCLYGDTSVLLGSLLWRRANARNVSQHTLYGVQHIHINLTLIHCSLLRTVHRINCGVLPYYCSPFPKRDESKHSKSKTFLCMFGTGITDPCLCWWPSSHDQNPLSYLFWHNFICGFRHWCYRNSKQKTKKQTEPLLRLGCSNC